MAVLNRCLTVSHSIPFKLGLHRFVLWGYFLVLCLVSLLQPCFPQKTNSFKCPQQFGYFQDLSDCNKYYICVFGDAVRDQCTSGLYFNNELRMCDWPRNVKNCDGSNSVSDSANRGRSTGTTTSRPRTSSSSNSNNNNNYRYRSSNNNNNDDEDDSLNSIAPAKPTQNTRASTRYTPPISSASYIAAARNSTHTHFRPVSSLMVKAASTTTASIASTTKPTTDKPLINAPASFKPVYYRVTNKPSDRSSFERSALTSNKRKDYEDPEYYDDYEDDESEDDRPKMVYNRNLRGGNNVYVTPIDPKTSVRPRIQSYQNNRVTNSRPRGIYATMSTYDSRYVSPSYYKQRGNSNNSYTTPGYSTFHLRGRDIGHNNNDNNHPGRNSASSESGSGKSAEDKRTTTVYTYNRNTDAGKPYGYSITVANRGPPYSQQIANQRPRQHSTNRNVALSSVYTNRPRDSDANIRLKPQVNHGRPSVSSIQSLDSSSGDSLDAQFGTNPRSISLPDAPYKLNSFIDKQPKRTQQQQREKKPQISQPKFVPAPPRQSYQQGSNSGYDDDYSDYYYDDDDEYYDDDDQSDPQNRPKVVIRVQQKPSTTSTTQRPTTRRPASTTTTRKPPTTRPPKRQLPVGISRPATKRPLRFGPKSLPRLPSRPPPLYQTPRPLTVAEKCTPNNCVLPDCRCGSTDIPGSLPVKQVPQIVLITFDDAVNDLNYELYAEIFDGRLNPNGCPILGTFYVSHEWTDYGMVQSLYAKGHEMASHSITHSHGEKFSVNNWKKEINGQREILHLYGGVKLEDIRGMRAPFLQVGGNNMFEMLFESNFTYDSSMPVLDNNPPFFPYTLDFSLPHECMIPPCPTKSFPGLWEVGMVMWNDYRGGRCSMGDACANPDNADDVFKMLLKNFNRHYESNRAPFGLFYHAAWFTTQHYRKGYLKFIEHINAKNDVYMVTNWQAIQWMREPTPLSHIKSFRPWQCPKNPDSPGPCHHPTSCSISHKGGSSRNLKTCQPCPSTYPWTGRTGFDEVYG